MNIQKPLKQKWNKDVAVTVYSIIQQEALTPHELYLYVKDEITQARAEEREKIRKEITVIFSGEEKDLQDLLNAPSLKMD